jgi:hypothetical protein
MRTLTEEQKDALAEDGYIQAQKMKKLFNKWMRPLPQQHKIWTVAKARSF